MLCANNDGFISSSHSLFFHLPTFYPVTLFIHSFIWPNSFPKRLHHLASRQQCMRFPTAPYRHLDLTSSVFFILTILVVCNGRYLPIALRNLHFPNGASFWMPICHHLSSWVKSLLISFVFLMLSFENHLYVLNANSFSNT